MTVTQSQRYRQQLKRVKWIDRLARVVVVSGGLLVILTVLAILIEIVSVAIPLFLPPNVASVASGPFPGAGEVGILDVGTDEYFETLTVLREDGLVQLISRQEIPNAAGKANATEGLQHHFTALGEPFPILPEGATFVSAVRVGEYFLALSAAGQVVVYQTVVRSVFDEAGKRQQVATPTILKIYDVFDEFSMEGATILTGSYSSSRGLALITFAPALGYQFMSFPEQEESDGLSLRAVVTKPEPQKLTLIVPDLARPGYSAALSSDANQVVLGGQDGTLLHFSLQEGQVILSEASLNVYGDFTALAFAFGDDSILVGDHIGRLGAVYPLKDTEGVTKLHAAKQFVNLPGAVKRLIPSLRSKQFLAIDDGGTVAGYYLSHAKELFRKQSAYKIHNLVVSPRDKLFLSLNKEGTESTLFGLDIPHPEIGFQALFGKIWYESYPGPAYVWQSTGGSDDFEPKINLMPLIFGTLKATFYAMLFAFPIGVFSAIYSSQFMSKTLRARIKPLFELMASVPSVVIGFIIALWLAPFLESWIISFLILACLVPGGFLLYFWALSTIKSESKLRKWTQGREFLLMIPVVLLIVAVSALLGPLVEGAFFAGNFSQWLYTHVGITYDQRNSIIVAVGLGFAVIPIIFSIADDSLSSVPANLSASSLALGASRWQTVWRIVLPSASPGIFAATMIGFGRAVGETMIVLMAAGNTPIIDMSPFNGMRTLSANIAVEIPEAPVDSTLFRTLFLCAVILFGFTFTLNTLAEIVRTRLRKKYGRF